MLTGRSRGRWPRRGGSAAECPRALPVHAIGYSYAARRLIEVTSEYRSGTSSRRTGNAGSGGFKPSGVDVTTFPGFGALRSLPRSEQGPQGAPRVESVGAAPATGPSDATARLGVRPRGVPLYVCPDLDCRRPSGPRWSPSACGRSPSSSAPGWAAARTPAGQALRLQESRETWQCATLSIVEHRR
jgi:hypothetical protein